MRPRVCDPAWLRTEVIRISGSGVGGRWPVATTLLLRFRRQERGGIGQRHLSQNALMEEFLQHGWSPGTVATVAVRTSMVAVSGFCLHP